MDLAQIAKTVDWLDSERRKDKQEITALQERLAALATENASLIRRLQVLESTLTSGSAQLQRVAKFDDVLSGYRKEMTRHIEELEKRRQEAGREEERLRKVERDGLNKSLAEARKGLESLTKLERDLAARREEEQRVGRLMSDLQKKVEDMAKLLDERSRAAILMEDSRRQDSKRLADLASEVGELRRRTDDGRGKLDAVEDVARRSEARLGELQQAEADRRQGQTMWLEAQAVRQSEQERTALEMRARMDAWLESMEEYARRVNQYGDVNREVERAAAELRQSRELLDRRMNEITELQRLGEDRLRQDWAAYLAEDQKRWTTHMLLRDEQWREHDRTAARESERLEALEEQAALAADVLRRLQEIDAGRLQSLVTLLRDMAAEYEKAFTPVR